MALIIRNKRLIAGLEADLAALATSISNEGIARSTADGNLASLVTTAKDNLVNAVNEVKTQVNSTDGVIGNISSSGVSGSTVSAQLASLNSFISTINTTAIPNLQQQVDALLSNTDATALNSLAEIVTAFQAADNTLNGAITTLANNSSTAITTLSGSVDAKLLAAETDVNAKFAAVDSNYTQTMTETRDKIPMIYRVTGTAVADGTSAVKVALSDAAGVISVMGKQIEGTNATQAELAFLHTGSFLISNFGSVRCVAGNVAYDLDATYNANTGSGASISCSGLSIDEVNAVAGKTITIEVIKVASPGTGYTTALGTNPASTLASTLDALIGV